MSLENAPNKNPIRLDAALKPLKDNTAAASIKAFALKIPNFFKGLDDLGLGVLLGHADRGHVNIEKFGLFTALLEVGFA